MLNTLLWHGLQRFVGVGLQPGFAAEPRLKSGHYPVFIQVHSLHHQARGLMAQAVVRIAVGEIALRCAMVRHDQLIWLSMVGNVALNTATERINKFHGLVVPPDELQLRHPAGAFEHIGHGIKGRPGGGARILGIKWQHSDIANVHFS